MKNLDQPLTENEVQFLDDLLLDRIDDDTDTDELNEGIICISELDGFLTAIVSGPVSIMPSIWLPAVWGDFQPAWENQDDLEKCLTLIMRHMNNIASILIHGSDEFEPMFELREFEDEVVLVVDEWCEGYMRAVELSANEWKKAGKEIMILLAPVRAFTIATDWAGHNRNTEEMINIQNVIAPNVREIHSFWLSHRTESRAPYMRVEPRVGRNDPCPCGSGKKYKKCCLH